MSYSFSVSGTTKDEVKSKISAAFDNVVTSQPPHAADKNAAVAAGHAFVDLLTDPGADQHVTVSMHGSLGWNHPDPKSFTGAGVGISASLQAKSVT